MFHLRFLGTVSNYVVYRSFSNNNIKVMTRNKQKFEISLFNGKTIFMI